jgi:hypothetical protein
MQAAALEKLQHAVVDTKIAKLGEDCCNCIDRTDAPSTIIELADKSGTKTIRHYHGCSSAPDSIFDFEAAVLETTGATRWIGSEAERKKQKWNRNSP